MPVITRLLTDTIETLPVDAVAPIPKIAGAAGNATPTLPSDRVAETPVIGKAPLALIVSEPTDDVIAIPDALIVAFTLPSAEKGACANAF
tara:strand:- start:805 stop:1074 length:270 start_codon:yes stop_codon:yes gene_type:complete